MAYIVVENFSAGVDRRRPIHSSNQGTLWEGINGHLSRGGDFEKRKAFVETFNVENMDTFGLQTVGDDVYVFGSVVEPAGLPAGLSYQRLEHSTHSMTKLIWSTLFDGKIYAIAKFDNGDIRHFYDGTLVADWGGVDSGDPDGIAEFVLTFDTKMYGGGGTAASALYFSKINDPSDWNDGSTGAGFINMSNQDEGSASLTGLAPYIGQLAVFSRSVIQIWLMNADETQNAKQQVLRNTGTRAPKSIQAFGDIDVFYLHSSGIRSLRARDSSNAASVNDVGTLIDILVQEWAEDLTEQELKDAPSIIEPSDNRYWLALGSRIVVFSYFPGSKISGWSWYEPGFTPEEFALPPDNTGPYVRAADKIYKYGGSDNQTYGNDYDVTLFMPFLHAEKPGHFKDWQSVDILAKGDWQINLLTDPNDLTREAQIGSLTDYTVNEGNSPMLARSACIAPKLTHKAGGFASISGVLVYYQMAETESER